MKNIDNITEQSNSISKKIHTKSIFDIIKIMNYEDAQIALSVKPILPEIEKLILKILAKVKSGGRLFYIGCGTSGRLGVLDASECPPTFSTSPDLIQGIIAGGKSALHRSVEGAEDIEKEGRKVIEDNKINSSDVIVGISASGSAPFVLGALKEGSKNDIETALITFNPVEKKKFINHLISIVVGPEIISGSTRLKAGTATKMVLNMITTSLMVKLNKTYENFMVDLKVSNKKLLHRALHILNEITGLDKSKCKHFLNLANGEVKSAIVMIKLECDYNKAVYELKKNEGNLHKIID